MVEASKADEYAEFMKERAVRDYSSVDGLKKLLFLRDVKADVAHFLLVTHWDSMGAVTNLPEKARKKQNTIQRMMAIFLNKEETSALYEVFYESNDAKQMQTDAARAAPLIRALERKENRVRSYWNGTEPLVKTFWLLYVLGSISIAVIISLSVLVVGVVINLPTYTITFLVFLLVLLLNPFYFFCWVSLWRSSNNSKAIFVNRVVKALVVIHVVFFGYNLTLIPTILTRVI